MFQPLDLLVLFALLHSCLLAFQAEGDRARSVRCIKCFNFTPFGCVVEKYFESNTKYLKRIENSPFSVYGFSFPHYFQFMS